MSAPAKSLEWPEFKWAVASEVGACNFCNRHTTEHGYTDHYVLIIERSGGGMQVRACRTCLHRIASYDGPQGPEPTHRPLGGPPPDRGEPGGASR